MPQNINLTDDQKLIFIKIYNTYKEYWTNNDIEEPDIPEPPITPVKPIPKGDTLLKQVKIPFIKTVTNQSKAKVINRSKIM